LSQLQHPAGYRCCTFIRDFRCGTPFDIMGQMRNAKAESQINGRTQ
jgi:hypothetical protein